MFIFPGRWCVFDLPISSAAVQDLEIIGIKKEIP